MKYIYTSQEVINSLENTISTPLAIMSLRLGGVKKITTQDLLPYLNIEQLILDDIDDLSMLDLSSFKKLKEVVIQNVRKVIVSKFNLQKQIDRIVFTKCQLEPKLDLSGLNLLTELKIQETNIEELLLNRSQPFIERMDLDNNQLAIVPTYINNYSNLKFLSLNNNQINNLPQFSSSLKALTMLYIGGNKLTIIEEELYLLSNLEVLYLGNNALTNIKKLPASLKKLSLSQNQLSFCPKCVKTLKEITNLSINRNAIKTIDLNGLVALEVLNLAHCQLDRLPQHLGSLSELTEINFSGNKINDNSEDICIISNSKLKVLNMSSCYTLKGSLILKLESNQIEKINLSSCDLTSISLRANTTKVQLIDLSYNDLTEIPAWIFSIKNLKILNLTGNKMAHVNSEIHRLLELRELSLSDNQIASKVDDLIELPNLEKLDLSENEIASFKVAKDRFNSNLQKIDLSYNPIQKENIDTHILELPFELLI